MTINKQLHGIIIPVHTPFKKDTSIDIEGLKIVIQELCDCGADGLLILGSSGEFGSLTIDERMSIAEEVLNKFGKSIPIIVSISDSNMSNVMALGKHAHSFGAFAVMCLPPYLLAPTQEDIYSYFADIAQHVDTSIVIYNNPGRTNIVINPSTISRLAEIDQIQFLKDSGRNLRNTSDIIQSVGDSLTVWSGEADLFLPILSLGAKGGIIVPSLIAPSKAIQLYKAASVGDYSKAKEIHFQLMELAQVLGSEGKYHSATKAALRIQGRPGGYMRPPVSDVSDNCKERLKKVMKKIGVLHHRQ